MKPEIYKWAAENPEHSQGLVVMSGGQDSTTCLGVALAVHGTGNVGAITFNYGQKHAVEVQQAKVICEKLDVPLHEIDLAPVLQSFQSSALVNGGDVSKEHAYLKNRPASFVPVRNALFLTTAYGFAMEWEYSKIYTGVCQTDYSGYPDCRDDFIGHFNVALDTGYETDIEIRTPLMFLDKAQTFALAEETNVLEIVLEDSHTCYNGDHTTWNEWGYGCGTCPACELRANGWEEYKK